MGSFAVVRPRDDADAQQASDWCDDLVTKLTGDGHSKIADVDDRMPPNTANIVAALGLLAVDLVCYFGHGDEHSWLTNQSSTVDASNVKAAQGKAVVSVACKTACNLGPAAITSGVVSWLGFTIKVVVMRPHKTVDPVGDAIVGGLSCLGGQGTMQQARDEIATNCGQLIDEFDTGRFSNFPEARLGYYAAMALRDHVVVHGTPSHQPLP